MPIQIHCTACSYRAHVKSKYAGKRIRCPDSRGRIEVPQSGDVTVGSVEVCPPPLPPQTPPQVKQRQVSSRAAAADAQVSNSASGHLAPGHRRRFRRVLRCAGPGCGLRDGNKISHARDEFGGSANCLGCRNGRDRNPRRGLRSRNQRPVIYIRRRCPQCRARRGRCIVRSARQHIGRAKGGAPLCPIQSLAQPTESRPNTRPLPHCSRPNHLPLTRRNPRQNRSQLRPRLGLQSHRCGCS